MQSSSTNTSPKEVTSWHKSVGPFSMHLYRNDKGEWELRAHYLGNQCLVNRTVPLEISKDLPWTSAAWALISDLQLVVYGWGKSLEGLNPASGVVN
jgi:hypothetical protein